VTDVVVVGGGVAGAAAATRLATEGREVLVLERESVYSDRVRGEGMVPWGLEAARALGVAEAVLGAPGASCMTTLVAYDELVSIDDARRRSRSLVDLLPAVPGLVAVGHPELRQALADAATAAGATVARGVEHVEVSAGLAPEVHYTLDGARHRVRPRLVVGADGKESAVRRALGVELHSTTPTMMLTGMLVDDGGAWDRAEVTIGVHGANQLYVFPRVGAVRLYVGRMIDAERLSGPDRVGRMLEAFRRANLPHAGALADARPIGPCATFPMTDTWTSRPYGPGAVLLGDAAGWSNPVTGQGLAVAFRDAQVLTELLGDSDDWSEATFERYARERSERMRRLRFASALTDLLMAQGVPDRAERKARLEALARRQPALLAALDAVHRGPWRVPEEAFEPSILTALAAA
jgi:2-polyprenyl-6-methoxyphenol hydroxylase-like FAD-dependent oxidoreductase